MDGSIPRPTGVLNESREHREAVVACAGVTKVYPGGVAGLRDVTLSIRQGESFALLGENGAGKSTLVRLLLGFVLPTSGTLRVYGEERVTLAHLRIGYVHERPTFEPRFTGREHLRYYAALAGLRGAVAARRIDELLERVHLESVGNKRSGTYSKGMLQRLAIAQALLTAPDLLILDEPTSGLDPLAQWEIRQIIAALHHEGKTIVLCSHYLAEVEALCETVGILRRGRLVRAGAVKDLLGNAEMVEIVLAGDEPAESVAVRLGLVATVVEARDHSLRFPAAEQQRMLGALVAANVAIRSLTPLTPSLEEVYVRLTQPGNTEYAPLTSSALASTRSATSKRTANQEDSYDRTT
ncbi:MAG TPA: ABC transporter ATP-binding protein [Ktedonobacterales bacterium]